jgi:hypothetical protein
MARHRVYLAQQRPQIFVPCDSDKLEIFRQPHIGKRLQAMLVKVQEAATAAIKAPAGLLFQFCPLPKC